MILSWTSNKLKKIMRSLRLIKQSEYPNLIKKCRMCEYGVRVNTGCIRLRGGCCPTMRNQKNNKPCNFKPKRYGIK